MHFIPFQRVWRFINDIRPKTVWGWLIWGLLGSVVLMGTCIYLRFAELGRIEQAIQRKFEIRYTFERPATLVHRELRRKALDGIRLWRNHFPHQNREFYGGYDWTFYPDYILANRVESLGRGRLIGLEAYDTACFSSALGKEIGGHRKLQFLLLANLDTPLDHQVVQTVMASISGHQELRELEIIGTWIDDDSIALLTDLPKLERLEISDAQITEKSVPVILKFRKLRRLYMTDIRGAFSQEEVMRLKAANPDAEFLFESEDLTIESEIKREHKSTWLMP